MSDWQPIETAPKDGTPVLLFVPTRFWMTGEKMAVGFWGVGDDWFHGEADSHSMTEFGDSPTHWMPLPDPPR